jgi:hypothetical protein
MGPALLDRRAQRRAFGEQVGLADELLERARAHAHGERASGRFARGGAPLSPLGVPASSLRLGVEQRVLHSLSIARYAAISNNNVAKWERGTREVWPAGTGD